MTHIPTADDRSIFDPQAHAARERIADLHRAARRDPTPAGRSLVASARRAVGSRLIRLGAALASDESLSRAGRAPASRP